MPLHIGTYARNGGAGLYPLLCEGRSWRLGEPYSDAANASFGTCAPRFGLWYFVDERPEGAIGVHRHAPDGWKQVARVGTGGSEPCYVALNASQSHLAVANYGSGSIALFALDSATGLPRDAPQVWMMSGRGPVAKRQEGPHAHCILFDSRADALYHVDLGADRILRHTIDEAGRLGGHQIAYMAPPGSGPRHLALHPRLPLAYLVSELASTLTVFDRSAGWLRPRQIVSTLPDGFAGESLGGHVALNAPATRLYVTNRGHDSIAVFAIDGDGAVSLLQHVPSHGASPRCFVLLEDLGRLALINEEGGNAVILPIESDGLLDEPEADIAVPGPAFLFTGG